METLFTLLTSAVSGAAAWFITNFFAKPLLDFYQLRGRVHEELMMFSNIRVPDEKISAEAFAEWLISREKPRYEEGLKTVYRLSAQLSALQVSTAGPAHSFLRYRYNITSAWEGLRGVGNTLPDSPSYRRIALRNQIEVALNLPRTYSDEQVRQSEREHIMSLSNEQNISNKDSDELEPFF